MPSIFVIDTSYLCELYAVRGFSTPDFTASVRARVVEVGRNGGRFVVPVGCIFELCDHVADVPNGDVRRTLATQIASDVSQSIESGLPWVLNPAGGGEAIRDLVDRFSKNPAYLALGLTDSSVVDVAVQLKAKYGTGVDYRVHIWAKDVALKAHEPDAEPNPL